MKKSLTGVVALLAGAYAVHCQGVVAFGNYGFLTPYIYVSLGSTLLGGSNAVTTGVPEMDVGNGNDWTIALYGNSGTNVAASNLSQLETWGGQPVVANLETNNQYDSDPGTWFSSTIAMVPGNSPDSGWWATLQVRAWYNRGGQYDTYEAALSAGVPVGVSAFANVDDYPEGPMGNPPQPPQTAPGLPSGTGPGELGNIILSYPTNVSQSVPVLTARVAPGSVTLTWPTNGGGFALQSTTNLGSPINWANVSTAPVVVNGQNTVTNTTSGGQRYFRLAVP